MFDNRKVAVAMAVLAIALGVFVVLSFFQTTNV